MATQISDVAKELRLDWHTVKALEKQYMGEQLRRAGTPGPTVLGLDEVSIKKGQVDCERLLAHVGWFAAARWLAW